MNCCREIAKMGVPKATVPRYRGIGSEPYLNGTSQGPTPEDARKDGHIRGHSHAKARIHEISGLKTEGILT